MKIAAVQFDILWEDRQANYAKVEVVAAAAANDGADMLVLPEMFATGFSMNPAVTAEKRGGPTETFVRELAQKHKIGVIAGLVFEGDGDKGRNAALALDRSGEELACYEKIHLFSVLDEHKHHLAGDGPKPFEFEGIRFSCSVCYDLRFPELFRQVAAKTDVAVIIASWPNARQRHFDLFLEARAVENQHFVVGVNRIGSGGGLDFDGGTAIFDPSGERIAYGGREETVVMAPIEIGKIDEFRAFMACHRDRRF